MGCACVAGRMADVTRYEKKRADVLGIPMAYVEVGEGDPIVLLHVNPTSSYLWRDVIPHLEGLGRCIAPDLVGMGDSDPLPDPGPMRYSFAEHRRHLDALLDQLGVTDRVTLVATGVSPAYLRDHLLRALKKEDAPDTMLAVTQFSADAAWHNLPPDGEA